MAPIHNMRITPRRAVEPNVVTHLSVMVHPHYLLDYPKVGNVKLRQTGRVKTPPGDYAAMVKRFYRDEVDRLAVRPGAHLVFVRGGHTEEASDQDMLLRYARARLGTRLVETEFDPTVIGPHLEGYFRLRGLTLSPKARVRVYGEYDSVCAGMALRGLQMTQTFARARKLSSKTARP